MCTSTSSPCAPWKTNVIVGMRAKFSASRVILPLPYSRPERLRQAFLKAPAAFLGKYVSVVPESTITPLPLLYELPETERDTSPTLSPFNFTVNHPLDFAKGTNFMGSWWMAESAPPMVIMPPPFMKHKANVLASIKLAFLTWGMRVVGLEERPMMPSARWVRNRPVSENWHPNMNRTARACPMLDAGSCVSDDDPPSHKTSSIWWAFQLLPSV
mmetsp:Transcript_20712/g.60538  ORF Transcript_20712/g.60538 Transcript_20712/m.60538 type:complete len:214 (-) Transcript_20712:484-1125(-)